MRSGNGRHRRPRQAPAALVAAGVTGAGLALPLLGASGASAADGATWDRVAECESGGMWSADKNNGYYGGLQLTQEMWERFGGTAYADRADLASRGQQITVAEKILAEEGPGVWTCAAEAGLTQESTGDPGVDPGDLEAEQPQSGHPSAPGTDDGSGNGPGNGADAGDGTGNGSDEGAGDGSDDGADTGAGNGADPATGDGTAPGEGSGTPGDDRTEPPADDPSGGTGAGPQPGGTPEPSPGTGTGKHRGTPADEEGRPAGEDGRASRDGRDDLDTYTVRAGDSLSAIAAQQGIDGGWTALYAENRETVGGDENLIVPGQRLHL